MSEQITGKEIRENYGAADMGLRQSFLKKNRNENVLASGVAILCWRNNVNEQSAIFA